jgi:hypothetical protein
LQPGRSGTIASTRTDGGVTVDIDGQHVAISAFASARILVTAA